MEVGLVPKMLSPSEHRMILENTPICCVDLVIRKGGKVLLVKRKMAPSKNEWWVPGGRVLKNERLIDTARRKAREEVGLKIKIERMLDVIEMFFKDGRYPNLKGGTHGVSIVFLASANSKKIRLDKDHLAYKWAGKIERDLHPYVKRMLRRSGVF